VFGVTGFYRGFKYGFFRPEQQGNEPSRGNAKRTNAQRDTEGWGKIICRLIAAGHNYSEIADYTLSQVKIFAKYAQELERERRATLIADLAIASQGSSKGIGQAVDRLLG
jgi:hypothetical protein